jgi:hypothetical protein
LTADDVVIQPALFEYFRLEVGEENNVVEDAISAYIHKSWDELFGMERGEIEAFQLQALKTRFDSLAPGLKRLKSKADRAKIASIHTLTDVVPLLFNHTEYKSYPLSLLEKNRFDLLTRWFDDLTSVDLSGISVAHCGGIDEWLDTLESHTALRPNHTTGTSGKLSFIPRTTLERDLYFKAYTKNYEGFGDQPGFKLGGDGVRVPVIYPSVRHGRYIAQTLIGMLAEQVAPSPDQLYTQSSGSLSADLASLAGRIRVAQAKGELSNLHLSDAMRAKMRAYFEELERRPEEMSAFFESMARELQGERVFVISQASYLFKATLKAEELGMSNIFSADSFGSAGGGGKDIILPDDWKQRVSAFTGINQWASSYAMTEITGTMPMCEFGHYHIQPLHIPFLLDPDSGECLPRNGRRTGRFAFYDLMPQTYWGGFITGDEVTIEWDSPCPCGRKGVYAVGQIERYSSKVTGDDKITCAATVDNTDASLQALLG